MIFTPKHKKLTEDLIEYTRSRIYKKISDVPFTGFVTRERLSLDEAKARPAVLMEPGTKWGKKWEYAWLFAEVKISDELDGKRVVFKAPLGEGIVFVNGMVFGALDKEHKEITLTQNAKLGEKFDIAFEVYAGHGPEDLIFTALPGTECGEFSEDILQKVIENGEIGTFSDEVFMFLMDINTLFILQQKLDTKSLRYKMLSKCVKSVCAAVDVESNDEGFIKQITRAREIMKPYLECKNGSTASTFFVVGHSHLDLEWTWALNETRRKTARTLGNQLKIIEEYPEYRYVQSQPWIFETVKNEYPELYSEVKKAIADGKIIPEGGTWVEMDSNLPSGESIIRQFILGKKFVRDEFEKECRVLWLPDVFGISAALPQIMKGCGTDFIYNAKMSWSYDNKVPLPTGTYKWRGIDGTEVVLYSNPGYASTMRPDQNIDIFENTGNIENVPDAMVAFGHGDGGGGATREHLELAIRQRDLEGTPKIKMSTPGEFFDNVSEKYDVLKVFDGELWYAEHKGSYTTQAKTKKLNRKSEISLREAEFWTALSGLDENTAFESLWKEVLFNQFHDILPGTAVERVYERAEKSYEDVIRKSGEICRRAQSSFVDSCGDALTVFNSLPWRRTVEICLPDGFCGIGTADGERCHTYISEGKIYADVSVEGCGIKSFCLFKDGTPETETADGDLVLENEFLRAEFKEDGTLTSLRDKNGTEYISSPSNKFRMYKNLPAHFDAWDIDADYRDREVEIEGETTTRIVSRTKSKTILLVKKEMQNSTLEQRVILKSDSPRLDFETTVEWNETHKLLKVDFDTNINTRELLSEIQFGHIKRPVTENLPTDKVFYETFQHKWSALAEGGRCFAVLNDSKYGVSASSGKISLTLLTSSMAPMRNADKGHHTFTYSICPANVSLENSDIVREAYFLNCPAGVVPGYTEPKTLFTVSDKNVVLETVKSAENGSGDIIVRLYDSVNKRTKCTLDCGFDISEAYVTNMLEENQNSAEVCGNSITMDIPPFGILTLRIKIKK